MTTVADPFIAALLEERVGYVGRGLKERVNAVDAEIRRLGGEPPRPAEEAVQPPPERPGGSRPAGSQKRGSGRPGGQKA